MLVILIVFLSIVTGTLGEVSSCFANRFVYCDHLSPKDVTETSFPTNAEELREICPKALEYYECLVDYDKTCSLYDTIAETIISTTAVIKELCDEGSRLHNAYTGRSVCYKAFQEIRKAPDCEQISKLVIKRYFIYTSKDEESNIGDGAFHRLCMEKSYKMACMAVEMDDMCDERAVSTYLEVLRRSKYLSPICSESTVVELNEKFIELLELNQVERLLFRRVFDIQRK